MRLSSGQACVPLSDFSAPHIEVFNPEHPRKNVVLTTELICCTSGSAAGIFHNLFFVDFFFELFFLVYILMRKI